MDGKINAELNHIQCCTKAYYSMLSVTFEFFSIHLGVETFCSWHWFSGEFDQKIFVYFKKCIVKVRCFSPNILNSSGASSIMTRNVKFNRDLLSSIFHSHYSDPFKVDNQNLQRYNTTTLYVFLDPA